METSAKNILYITHRNQVIGGGEISLFELIRNLDRKRFTPFLVMAGGGDMSRLAEESGTPATPLDFPQLKPANAMKIFLALWRLTGFLHQEKIHLLHANTSRAMFYGGLAAKLSGRRMVWHVRITDKDPWMDGWLYHLADVVVCNSQATASRFAHRKDRGKIKVVYNGLDPKKYGRAAERKIFKNIPKDHKILLNVGRLEPWKGQDLFLEMAKMVKDRDPKVTFVLVGEDKEPGKEFLKRLERMAKERGLADHVLFLGERDDIPAILGEADVLVSTSKRESFGRGLLEAQASRIPVLAFKVGGVEEVVEDGVTGFLSPEGDLEDLAEKALTLLSDEGLRLKMGARGREKAMAEFTSVLHAKKVREIYEGMI